MIEVKAVLTGLFYFLGVPSILLGIITNFGTWKATVLFILSAVLLIVKIIYLALDKYQNFQQKKMELEKQRHELDRFKKN